MIYGWIDLFNIGNVGEYVTNGGPKPMDMQLYPRKTDRIRIVARLRRLAADLEKRYKLTEASEPGEKTARFRERPIQAGI